MITAIKFWNEPNNLSHWDFHMDPEWREYSAMIRTAADAVRRMCPQLELVLGGMSPIDADFVRMLRGYGLLEHLDAVAVHGFSTGTTGASTSGRKRSVRSRMHPGFPCGSPRWAYPIVTTTWA